MTRRPLARRWIAVLLLVVAVAPASGCFTYATSRVVDRAGGERSRGGQVVKTAAVAAFPLTLALDVATAPLQLPVLLFLFAGAWDGHGTCR